MLTVGPDKLLRVVFSYYETILIDRLLKQIQHYTNICFRFISFSSKFAPSLLSERNV